MRHVTLDVDRLAWFGKDGQFGEVGEDDDKRRGHAQCRLIGKTTIAHQNGVDTVYAAIHAIHQQLSLIHVTKASFHSEAVTIDTTARQQNANE